MTCSEWVIRRIGSALVVGVAGEAGEFESESIDQQTSRVLDAIATAPSLSSLVVNLSEVKYFGSSLLNALVRMRRIFDQSRGRAALTGLNSDTREILRITKIDRLWEFYDTEEKALKALQNAVPPI